MAKKKKKVDVEEYLKAKEKAARDDADEQLNRPPHEREIKLNSGEYASLSRLMQIEDDIHHAANWVFSRMDEERREEEAVNKKMYGWGVEKVPFNFRMDKPLVDALDAVAKKKGLKRSDAVRQALIAYLDS